jgi:hypothetical protein
VVLFFCRGVIRDEQNIDQSLNDPELGDRKPGEHNKENLSLQGCLLRLIGEYWFGHRLSVGHKTTGFSAQLARCVCLLTVATATFLLQEYKLSKTEILLDSRYKVTIVQSLMLCKNLVHLKWKLIAVTIAMTWESLW